MKLDGLMLNRNRFTKMIQELVVHKRMSYMDAIVHICEDNNIELEDVKKFISPAVKAKVEYEARKLNFLEKENDSELPFDE